MGENDIDGYGNFFIVGGEVLAFSLSSLSSSSSVSSSPPSLSLLYSFISEAFFFFHISSASACGRCGRGFARATGL